MGHGDHQDRELDSGDTGVLLKRRQATHGGLHRWLGASSSARIRLEPQSIRAFSSGGVTRGELRTLGPYWPESTAVNTVPGLPATLRSSDRLKRWRLHSQLLAENRRVVDVLLSRRGVGTSKAVQPE